MAHKPISLSKIADFENNLAETRRLRRSYSTSLFQLNERAHSLQGEEVLISGRLQTIGGVFLPPTSQLAEVSRIRAIVKYADIVDWDEHDNTTLPYLYVIAWSPEHDQTISAPVNEYGIRVESADSRS